LALRLQRTGIIAWVIGMLLLGLSYGSVLGDVESFFAGVELLESMLTPAGGLTVAEIFLAMIMSICVLISTIPVLMTMLRLKGEETRNRTEHLLGRAVSRTTLLGSYFLVSLIAGFVMLLSVVFGLWSAGNAVIEGGLAISMLIKAAMVYLPAVWIMLGATVLIYGIAPKFTGFVYLYLLFSFIVVYLGALLQFPAWLVHLSPFGLIPQIPVEDMNGMVVTIMTIIAFVLTIAGFIGYGKRDIQG